MTFYWFIKNVLWLGLRSEERFRYLPEGIELSQRRYSLCGLEGQGHWDLLLTSCITGTVLSPPLTGTVSTHHTLLKTRTQMEQTERMFLNDSGFFKSCQSTERRDAMTIIQFGVLKHQQFHHDCFSPSVSIVKKADHGWHSKADGLRL